MNEHRLGLLTLVIVSLIAGCGNSESSESTAEPAEPIPEDLVQVLNEIESEGFAAFCELLGPSQLRESFGREGDPIGRCIEAGRKEEAVELSYEIRAVEGDCAQVVLNVAGEDPGLLLMVDGDDGWFIRDIEDPDTPTSSDADCGRVRLFGSQ